MQLDIEMSFVRQHEILDLVEDLFTKVIETFTDKKILHKPWPRLLYADVMEKYGIDKPDIRFEMFVHNVSDEVRDVEFGVFRDVVAKGGVVKGLVMQGCAGYSRKQMDDITDLAKQFGAKGLAWIALTDDGAQSPIVKFFTPEQIDVIAKRMGAKIGDMMVFVADTNTVATDAIGQLRFELGQKLGLVDPNVLACAFVVDFPLFVWNEDEGRLDPSHHMFTAPKDEDIPLLDTEPLAARSWQHDFVINGVEAGGGSLRIHDSALQEKIFNLIGLDLEDAKAQFGHMITAFQYGAPPHGGIAPGLERLLYLLFDAPNIREVQPFPKTQKAQELMTGSPSSVYPQQLKEIGIEVRKHKS
jgi:aspartyl-tRNA synthetase